jgi:2-polyprenyl-3-methyl-5-hydroxy-6-metoxy-1,4-benzoquinol methylase
LQLKNIMTSDLLSDTEIINAWHANATPWTTAVRSGDIESRRLVTDDAILDAVLSQSPQSVLDLGCGEGWLARALSFRGIRVIGIDVVPELIEQAQSAGGGDFRVASYEDVAAGKLGVVTDAVVCNFSLIGKESVDGIIASAKSMLRPGGAFIVQTLHPLIACGDQPYTDGWRPGSWAGFSDDFVRPAPWYFRTVETWIRLFEQSGLDLREVREPLHPNTGKPASILFIAGVAC